jgi:DNA polymerase III epsilon subunit-like protein
MHTLISVDVETAGPNPHHYSLLSIGACTLGEPQQTFYVELKPVNDNALPEALAVSGLTLEGAREHGLEPAEAMASFTTWLDQVVPGESRPLFAALNAPFDWMFVADYFYRFLGRNPFGHAALDIKSLYMGLTGLPWSGTSMRHISSRYLNDRNLSHHALRDAIDQAEILKAILAESQARRERQED